MPCFRHRPTGLACPIRSFLLALIGVPSITVATTQYVAIDLGPVYPSLSAGFGAANGQQAGVIFGSSRFATVWSGTAASAVNLNPDGFTGSIAYATDGSTQVGMAYGPSTGTYMHAITWQGSAGSYHDLNPAGAISSIASAVSGNLVAGASAVSGAQNHATLWNTQDSTVIDLNPSGATTSMANAIAGDTVAGAAQFGGTYHALLWHGSASNYTDLTPASGPAIVRGAFGSQQVGTAGAFQNAALWNGTSASFVNLNGSLAGSAAYATNGLQQVGEGNPVISGIAQGYHALVWSGSSAYVDLSTFLPSNFSHSTSVAMGIDANGNIFGTAYYTFQAGSQGQAFMWVPVPEPAGMASVAGVAFLLFAPKRRVQIARCRGFSGR